MTHRHLKTVAIAHETVFRGAIVIPKHLFIKIAEQMKRLNINVSTLQSALEQAPEVFQAIGVDLSVNIMFRMVNRLVNEVLLVQSPIGEQGIGIDRALCFNVRANLRFKQKRSRPNSLSKFLWYLESQKHAAARCSKK